jgi:hypothetical protein
VEGTNLSFSGAGPFTARLSPGVYRIAVSAPGFGPRTVEFEVRAREATDLGAIELARLPQVTTGEPEQAGIGFALLLVSVAAAAGITLWRRRRTAAPKR